ncbi:MAG: nucleotidyltransferase [bacterium]|nr:nucleotidyltransferase [bacterium]
MQKEKEEILYEEVFAALNKEKINYVVCGGAAVVILGFSRLTIDLDLIVSLEKENLDKLYDVLSRLGYRTRASIKKEEFIQREVLIKLASEKNMKVVSFYDPKDAFKIVDIGVNLPGASEILKRKRFIKIGKLSIPVINIDDLIKMKENLARPKDIIDAENLKKIKQEQDEKK